jgi:prophage antirepressor-like protein
MQSLQKTQNNFTHEIFGELTTITNDSNDVFFISNEVSRILEYSENRKMLERLDDDEVIKFTHEEAKRLLSAVDIHSSGIQLLTESGLFSAVLGSKKSEAKAFKKWVTSEVLPSIRKTGGYGVAMPSYQIADEVLRAEAWIKEKKQHLLEIENKEAKIKVLEPKAEFYDTVVDTTDTFDFAEAAKMMNLGIGRNTLLAKLRGRNILNKDNVPYQRYISAGYFEVKQSKYTIGDKVKIHAQARFTQKGIKWVVENKKEL